LDVHRAYIVDGYFVKLFAAYFFEIVAADRAYGIHLNYFGVAHGTNLMLAGQRDERHVLV
jgi:hypothetical protein